MSERALPTLDIFVLDQVDKIDEHLSQKLASLVMERTEVYHREISHP